MRPLSGIFCAFWTPTDERGELLWPQIDRHLQFILDAGVHGFMAAGSTAEFPQLSIPQRKQILERLVRTHLPIIANVSDVSHRTVIDLARHAKQSGAAAIAVLPPWFFPMAQPDLAAFFITIARAAELPLVLYNFPEVCGKKIELETIQRVAAELPVAAVKQSGADYSYHHDLLRLSRELRDHSFAVLTGADTRLEETLALGCTGTVSGIANAVPNILRKVYDNHQSTQKSPTETALLATLGQRLNTLEFPLNVKALIEARGFDTGALKNPISSETSRRYDSLCTELKTLLAPLPK
jgi:4-hydroxy-tetrahydrodipicolinate synthase